MNNYYNTVDVNILVKGNPVATYFKDEKTYIEAKDGSEYEIQIKNKNFNRILALASVDGLDVLTGEPSSNDDGGYVINPYDSFKVKGFRYSNEKVGSFKFVSNKKSSVSNQILKNCGTIVVKIFCDASAYTYTATSPTFVKNSETCNFDINHNLNENCRFNMGSTWGSSKESKVTSTDFDRGYIIHSFEFHYASRNTLLEMGVIGNSTPKVSFPKGFIKYAVPPKDWIG